MSKAAIIIPAIALCAGVGIGNASEPNAKEVAAKLPKPEVVERVVEKRVEVPVEKVVEKRVEKKVTPQACLDAIDAARDVASGVAVFAEASGEYPPLVGQALQAGVSQDVGAAADILSEMKSANDDLNKAVEMTAPAVAAFNKAAEACKK